MLRVPRASLRGPAPCPAPRWVFVLFFLSERGGGVVRTSTRGSGLKFPVQQLAEKRKELQPWLTCIIPIPLFWVPSPLDPGSGTSTSSRGRLGGIGVYLFPFAMGSTSGSLCFWNSPISPSSGSLEITACCQSFCRHRNDDYPWLTCLVTGTYRGGNEWFRVH